DRSRQLGPRLMPVHQLPGAFLERNGNIQPVAALLKEIPHFLLKFFQGGFDRRIPEVLTGLGSKQAMDSGRLAMADRIAHHCIDVHCIILAQKYPIQANYGASGNNSSTAPPASRLRSYARSPSAPVAAGTSKW